MRSQFAVCAVAYCLAPVIAPAQTPTKAEIEAEIQKKEALDHAYALGERFTRFNDPLASATSLALLGQAVCRYNHAYAESQFTNAVNTVASAQHVSADALAHTRAQVIARTAACDASLARKLNTGANDDASISAGSALQSARAVLSENPQAGADFARDATTGPLDAPDLAAFMDFLNQLRQKGETDAANDLFLTRTAWTSQQPAFDPAYAVPGSYISGAQQPDSAIVVPWLEGAADLISRAGPNDLASAAVLVTAAVLMSQQYAPELEPQFQALCQQVTGSVLHPTPPEEIAANDDEALLKKDGNPVVQDDLRVRLIEDHWSAKETKHMRELAAGITDTTIQAKLDALISFAEAAADPRSPSHVRASTKSALLALSRHDPTRAAMDARYADVKLRPYIVLGAARLANSQAWSLLAQAIDAFNEMDDPSRRKEPPRRPASAPEEKMSSWDEMVETGVSAHRFPLRSMASVSCLDLKCALTTLGAADPDRADALLANMENERRQAEALTYLASARLARAFNSTHPQEAPAVNPRQPAEAASSPSR
jgi:hypothetical protein